MIKIINDYSRISMYDADNIYKDCNYLMIRIQREDSILYGYIYAISDSVESNTKLLELEKSFSDQGIPTLIGGEYKSSLGFDNLKIVPAVKEGFMTLGEHFDWECQERQREDILELLEDMGPVSEVIFERLEEIVDPSELSRLLKAAARAGSREEFEEAMGLYTVV